MTARGACLLVIGFAALGCAVGPADEPAPAREAARTAQAFTAPFTVTELRPDPDIADRSYGTTVAIEGNVALVSGTGATHVFERRGCGDWRHVEDLPGGGSIALSADTAVINHASQERGVSVLSFYDRSGASFAFRQQIDGGGRLKLSGDTLAAGVGPGEYTGGWVYMYEREQGEWQLRQTLTSELPDIGVSLPWPDGYGGAGIALAGNTLVVGAPNRNRSQNGIAFQYDRVGTQWIRRQILSVIGTQFFGSSAAMSGETLLISARDEEGTIYVFGREGNAWVVQDQLKGPVEFFPNGARLAMFGDRVIAAPGATSNGVDGATPAVLFERRASTWSEGRPLPQAASYDLNNAVAISADAIIVGRRGAADYETAVGSAFVYEEGVPAENDGGVGPCTVPEDAGVSPIPDASLPIDAGGNSSDAGSIWDAAASPDAAVPHDAGAPAADSGSTPHVDAAVPFVDGSTVEIDAAVEDGAVPPRAGGPAPVIDSGSAPREDAGVPDSPRPRSGCAAAPARAELGYPAFALLRRLGLPAAPRLHCSRKKRARKSMNKRTRLGRRRPCAVIA